MSAGRGIVGLFKRGWHEIPEVMGSSVLAIVGVGLGLYGLKHYYDNDLDNRTYKSEFVIFRSDDPRAAKIRQPQMDV